MVLSKWNVGESAPGKDVFVYGLEGNVEYFFGPSTLVAAAGPSEATTSVAGGRVRRYPGDPGFNRAGHTRKYLKDPGVRYGQGVPGRSFVVANWDASGNLLEKRQFSSNSSVRELNALLRARFIATATLGKTMKHYAKNGGIHTFERA
jgi:hypothetical protein